MRVAGLALAVILLGISLLSGFARADNVYVPLCLPRTVPPVDTIEVCLDGLDCIQSPAHEGRTSVAVHGDAWATVYVQAFAAGQLVTPPWSHPECDGFASFQNGSLVVGKSLRLGGFYGPREQSWIAARQNQRGQAYAVDVNADGRITAADLAIIDGYAMGTIPDDTAVLCIDYDCTPPGFYPPTPAGPDIPAPPPDPLNEGPEWDWLVP